MEVNKIIEDLINMEIAKNVAKLGETESINAFDQEVFGIFFIPYKSNWTWYMTEYDVKKDLAFGLVTGAEVEWGYFTLKELLKLGAVRYEFIRPRRTFREILHIELKKQMNEDEINMIFGHDILFLEINGEVMEIHPEEDMYRIIMNDEKIVVTDKFVNKNEIDYRIYQIIE